MRNKGIAAVTAIVLVALVAATLAAMATHFSLAAGRTRDSAAQAQLRQLLIAGTRQGVEKVSAGPLQTGEQWVIALPATVGDEARLVTKVQAATPARVELEMEAAIGRRRLWESATLENHGGQWQLTAARLGP